MSIKRPDAGHLADRLLNDLDAMTIPVDVVDIAQKLGVSVHYEELENEISGMLVINGDDKHIIVNKFHPANRQRFTIAHELGHLRLHDNRTLFVDTKYVVYRRAGTANNSEYFHPGSTTTAQEEREANWFAEALLMPESLIKLYVDDRKMDIRDEFDLSMLAIAFGVSEQAMSIRARTIKLLEFVDEIQD